MKKNQNSNAIPNAELDKSKAVSFEDGESIQSFLERIDGNEMEITPVFTMPEVIGVLEGFNAKVLSLKDTFVKILDSIASANNDQNISSYIYVFEMACDGLAPKTEDYEVLKMVEESWHSDRLIWRRQEDPARKAQRSAEAIIPEKMKISENEARFILERRKRYGIQS